MDIDEYTWRYQIKGLAFAKMVQISPPTFRDIKEARVSPKLVTALKILAITNGKIRIEELLSEADAQNFKNFLDAN